MTAKEFQEIERAIHEDLKITHRGKRGNCFVVHEKQEQSSIKQISFCFGGNDSVFILKQDENKHTIKFFKKANEKKHHKPINESCATEQTTDCCCDSIIFKLNQKEGDVSVYLCEIKSSRHKEHLKKAQRQFKASECFVKYFIECYKSYYQKDLSNSIRNFYYYYFYPKITDSSIFKKSETQGNNPQDTINIIFKPVEIPSDGCVTISAKQMRDFLIP
ncbi:hypothetical protein [Helicobacter bizzozeronii]|uniref:hypothetical protein n=1 Tax=Helicobacter bizzozeronii TaxID=56877 RepID=UPI000CF05757|nr:hypothetical protein [Helicobacter bizzozeronii]